MPLAEKNLGADRVQFVESLNDREIESLLANDSLRTLQTSSSVDSNTWDRLNSSFFPQRPDVQLRVYGFYSSKCDLSFVERLPNVRHFAADCLTDATGFDSLSALTNLESLSFGVYQIDSLTFLNYVSEGLTKLSLGWTKSKRPSLAPLKRFAALSALHIEGHGKDIEVVAELTRVQDLRLRSITVGNLSFLAPLTRLWSLDIKLGGTTNLSALEGMRNIKYLELWQIQGLRDISVVSTLYGLQYLFLQSLRNVRCLPDLSRLSSLRRIYLENMKGLQDVTALHRAPALEEFIHVSAKNMAPDQYVGLGQLKTLKRALVGFGSAAKNSAFEALMAASGIERYAHRPFSFC